MARKKKGGAAKQQQHQAAAGASTAAPAPSKQQANKSSSSSSSKNKTTTTVDGITVDVFPEVWVVPDGDAATTTTSDNSSNRSLVGAIDQGTSSTRFLLFTAQGQILASAQREHPQLYPRTGWHEHDPVALWQNTAACVAAVGKVVQDKLQLALNADTVAAVGITNQRETVIAWNRATGEPYHNAIVWDDTRTAEYAETLQHDHSQAPQLTATTGLPVSSYFAGTKVKWLLDHVPQLRQDCCDHPDQVCFGTVDSWLLFQLTGRAPKSDTTGRRLKGAAGFKNTGGTFQTDVTNASRWLFMDLSTCQWDPACIATVLGGEHQKLAASMVGCLPQIRPSSHVFGFIHRECGLSPAGLLENVPLAAVLGDQQAALFGQTAFHPGQAKNTYGTGLFLMMNTGTTPCTSRHGLLTTVAYQLGEAGPVHYALEGSVSHSGSTVQWLRDQLQIIRSNADSETVARTVKSSEGLYVVPAFAGLFAPHWRSDARGCLVGLQMSHHKGHVCRAVLEATAYQTKEVFDAMVKDTAGLFDMTAAAEDGTNGDGDATSSPLSTLSVDGGGTNNKLLMQFQADIIDVPVVKPKVMETTSLGAAFAAGLAVGVWKDLEEIQALWAVAATFEPRMAEDERAERVHGWNKAVSKSLGWVGGAYDQPPNFTPVAQPMSSRSLASLAASSSNNNNGSNHNNRNGNHVTSPSTPLKKVVETAEAVAAVSAPSLVAEEIAPPSAVVEEEKKSTDEKPAAAAAAVDKEAVPDEAGQDVAASRELPETNSRSVTPNVENGDADSYKKFTTATLGITAVAALGVGILLGDARRR